MKWIVRTGLVVGGHDILDRAGVTLVECKELCMANQPHCRSIDYFASTQRCFHNNVGWGDTKAYALDANAAGNFYMFCELGKLVWNGCDMIWCMINLGDAAFYG